MDNKIILGACAASYQLMQIAAVMEELFEDTRSEKSPYLQERNAKGRFASDFDDMVKDKKAFKENSHMDITAFLDILSKVEHLLKPKRNTHPNDGISPKHKLAVVLEYLACGTLQRHIASSYRISKQKFGLIIDEVCNVICTVLKDQIPPMTKEELARVSGTYEKWNFPNCAGSVDGKHVAVKCLPRSGSLFYNYKGFFSIVIMAVADGDYRFTYVDIGAFGSEGDANIFEKCSLGAAIRKNRLIFPVEADNETPYVFIAYDAFPLNRRIIKPYKPKSGKRLGDDENIFNYRLSRARRCVENAFGIMCSKFFCLSRKMFCGPDRANNITKACMYLHNYLIQTRLEQYSPLQYADHVNESGVFISGEFRKHLPANSLFSSNINVAHYGRQDESGRIVRNRIKNYFNSDIGSVPWQRQYAFLDAEE